MEVDWRGPAPKLQVAVVVEVGRVLAVDGLRVPEEQEPQRGDRIADVHLAVDVHVGAFEEGLPAQPGGGNQRERQEREEPRKIPRQDGPHVELLSQTKP